MIINRRNRILAALLALQVVLTVLVFLPAWHGERPSAPLFPDLKADDVTSLTVQDNSGNEVQLSKKDGVWGLPTADDYPAITTTVTTLLGKIVNLKTNRLISRTPGSQAALGVADNQFERRIDFEAAGQPHTLFLGTSVGSRSAHARVGGQNEVYLVDDLAAWQVSATATGWVDTAYVRFTADDATALMLTNAHGTFEFAKGADGNWTMAGLAAGEVFNPNNLISLVQQLSALSLVKPLGKEEKPEYGFANPSAVVTVTVQEGDAEAQTLTLRIGAKDEAANQYTVRSSASDYFVRVNAFAVDNLVTRSRGEFLQPTPVPTVAPDATPEATPTP